MTSVVPRQEAQPVLDSIRNTVARLGEGPNMLDINLEEMQEFATPGDQVSEVGMLKSISSDAVHSLLGSNNFQESTFSGFYTGNPSNKQHQSSTASSSSQREKTDKAHHSKQSGKDSKAKTSKKSSKGSSKTEYR